MYQTKRQPPNTFVFMRWCAVLAGIDFVPESDIDSPTSTIIAELVQAASLRSTGKLWSITQTVINSSVSRKVTVQQSNSGSLSMMLGVFVFTCHLTGLRLTTGCAITTQPSESQKHWLIGLASDEYFNEEAPAQLVLKNDMPYPGEQYSI